MPWINEGLPMQINESLHDSLQAMSTNKSIENNLIGHLAAYQEAYPDCTMPSYNQMVEAMNLIADYMVGYDV